MAAIKDLYREMDLEGVFKAYEQVGVEGTRVFQANHVVWHA